MSKAVLGMSMSLDGIAGPESDDADGMAVFSAILGWQFPLRSWREEQGQPGGEDSVDSRVWASNFARFGPQGPVTEAMEKYHSIASGVPATAGETMTEQEKELEGTVL